MVALASECELDEPDIAFLNVVATGGVADFETSDDFRVVIP
jgi:hypothetical protein